MHKKYTRSWFFVADFYLFFFFFSNYVTIMEWTFENILDCRKGAVYSVNPRLFVVHSDWSCLAKVNHESENILRENKKKEQNNK